MNDFVLKYRRWIKPYLLSNFPFGTDFLQENIEHIDWALLSRNENLDLNLDFIVQYENQIKWEIFNPLFSGYFMGEGRDYRLILFLDSFKDKLNWDIVSIYLDTPEDTEDIISRFYGYWNWTYLCFNYRINWNFDLISKFHNQVDWEALVENPGLEWTFDMLDEFEDEIDWNKFYYSSGYCWDYHSINRFRHHLNHLGVNLDELYFKAAFPEKSGLNKQQHLKNILNSEVFVKEELTEEYPIMLKNFDDVHDFVKSLPSAEKINFTKKIRWSEEAFSYMLNFKGADILHLSTYSNFIDPVQVLRKHSGKIIWKAYKKEKVSDENNLEKIVDIPLGASANLNIKWTTDMLDEFGHKLDWEMLSAVGNIEWTPELIRKHFHRFNKSLIFRNSFLYDKIIFPVLDEDLLREVLKED